MIVPARSESDRAFLVSRVAEKLKLTPKDLVGDMPFEVIACTGPKGLMGAVIFINYRWPSIEQISAGEPGWMSRENLRGLFSYPFLQLKCRRLTGIVARKNKHSRDITERLGFKLEGVSRHGFPDDDACIYGMVRKDCRWID